MAVAPFPIGNQANYVNTIFAKKLLVRFLESTILEKVTNTDYQGEISGKGSKVIIRHTPQVTIKDYTGTVEADSLGEGTTELNIDRAKYYAFNDDDIFVAQRDIKTFVSEASKNAAQQMAIKVEKDVFGNVYADAGFQMNAGTTGTPLAVSKNDILDLITDVNVKFTELNIPQEDRFIILPAWAVGLVRKSELRQAQITGDNTGVIRTGTVGTVDGLNIYSSNCLTVNGDGSVHSIAGIKQAVSFASQFVNNESNRSTTSFSTVYRGLKVYGFKTVQPSCLIDVLIKKA